MASIPYDRTLSLGNLVPLQKIKDLMDIAEIEKPQEFAAQRLRNLTESSHKMKMIALEMENMNISWDDQKQLTGEIEKLKKSMSKAAIELASETIACQNKLFDLIESQRQKRMSAMIESPLDYALSKVKQFPFSSDSMTFDVQYFRNEDSKEGVRAHSATVSSYVHGKVKFGSKIDSGMSMDVRNAMESQSERHALEGTIVIVADCNHRQTDVIAPLVLDPKKSVEAWNFSFPNDRLRADPASMYKSAMPPKDSELESYSKSAFGQNALHLLSGCSRGSSFVGFVHILKTESTQSSQVASALAKQMKTTIERNMALASMSGSFGLDQNVGKSLKALLGASKVESHCSLVTRGVLPSITASEIGTVIKSLKPDPQEIIGQLSAINQASAQAVNDNAKSFQEMGKEGKTGQQFMQLSSDFAQKTISTIKEIESKDNKVIDTNSLMNAFTDYINKAQTGSCGVPISFYLKRITKREIAATYVNKYFPNGATDQKAAIKGQLGAEPEAS